MKKRTHPTPNPGPWRVSIWGIEDAEGNGVSSSLMSDPLYARIVRAVNAYESKVARCERAVVKRAEFIRKWIDNGHICVRQEPAIRQLVMAVDRLNAAKAKARRKP